MTRVAVLVGSLRRESYSRKVANAIAGLFDDGGKLVNDNTKAFLTTFGQAFEGFIRKAAA
ncbi:hypothetical protein [Inquilinus sp. CAU 1745]|uniref:hypothetical protein n=1 Tax=Inquilinus sp. CAU 1745 TaxID=3140369 RepID=UPI00325AB3E0